MTAERRVPRIAASLRERRNDLRPVPPLAERLLHGLGASPTFADSVLGDLAEERARRAAEQGGIAAQGWYLREAIRAVPHLLWNAVRHGGADGRARVAAVLLGVVLVPAAAAAVVAALVFGDGSPAMLVFDGQRGSDIANGVVLNTRHPVQLVTQAVDAHGRTLPAGSVHYRWVAGEPVSVTPDGVVTCAQPGDAEVQASAGSVAKTLLVRCRPVVGLQGDLVISLLAGGPGKYIPLTARTPDGRPVDLLAFDVHVQDTTVVAADGLHIRPRAPGMTLVTVNVGDGQARIWVSVYERVATLAGLRPEQRLVSAPVRLAAGDTIRWPLPTGHLWLRFNPTSRSQPRPRIVVHGQVACMPAFGPTDQARCDVRAPGAWVRITNPRGARGRIAGDLALDRQAP